MCIYIYLDTRRWRRPQFEFVPQDTSEFKSNPNLNSSLFRDIPRNLIFSLLTSWLKSPHRSGFQFAFLLTILSLIFQGTGCVVVLLSLYQFNSTPEPRMYLHHERNRTGDISPSWGQPNTKVHTCTFRWIQKIHNLYWNIENHSNLIL